jgi:hypothetical protein
MSPSSISADYSSSSNAKLSYPHCSLEPWTLAYTKDEFTYQLSSASSFKVNEDTGQIHITHKYYDKAEWCLYRINGWNPKTPPVYIINTSDLTPKLQNELEQLRKSSPKLFDKVVTESVQSIMESINQRYYHISNVAFKVTWRFEE